MDAITLRKLEGWWVSVTGRRTPPARPAPRLERQPDFEDTAPMTFWVERRRQQRTGAMTVPQTR